MAKEMDPTVEEIETAMRGVQTHISDYMVNEVGTAKPLEDVWEYTKGTGGGVSRVWEQDTVLERGGVLFSGIGGAQLPISASKLFAKSVSSASEQSATTTTTTTTTTTGETGTTATSASMPFRATGVSLVFHPSNPHLPTVHMNVRYFEAGANGEQWWFGGGIDLTPYYPRFEDCQRFHETLRRVCAEHGRDYVRHKQQCDRYFYLPHRDECRGIGGIFFDHLNAETCPGSTKQQLLSFVVALGHAFTECIGPMYTKERQALAFSETQRDYQLLRRGRYVEFNLVLDRGTKFGLESQGRTESILVSMPAQATWRYNYQPPQESREAFVNRYYLRPQRWLEIQNEADMTNTREE
eukprot:CAMPEP_0177651262 /NCGR_PEP_ID=MMETSP0447-20121125/12440_1 /TAXON_ID=0 /ORGANISM="Stygamoeba regulata, Strain BSH-02190019" /LENGTH=352 /DNA_ID=CAMNT_0019154303 /DNA_START=78 /DNA_END=1136 /DNA_ORIENTATION=-